MTEVTQKRQLAAIMFTDIVGYTALMGEDEDKAFALLKKNRQIQKPLIEKFNGKWLKEIGDGVLASFTTVTDAVHCAAAIQEASQAEDDLKLKIGIHLGEVVFEGEDVFGDGVNIASRLESIAPAGGIWVSESVSQNMQNKAGFASRFVREERLKNVKDPVRIYEVLAKGEKPVKSRSLKLNRSILSVAGLILLITLAYFLYPFVFNQKTTKDISEVGLAIMPLRNISASEDIDFLSFALKDEVHEVLALSKKFAFLSSNMATAAYKDQNTAPQKVAEELGVAYVLAGMYRLSGDDLKVNVELVDGESGNTVWQHAYSFVYEEKNINPMQADIARNILGFFNVGSNNDNPTPKSINLEAYSHYVKGLEWKKKAGGQKEPLLEAVAEFEQATKLDSSHTQSWLDLIATKSLLANNYSSQFNKQYSSEIKSHLEVLSQYHPQWALELATGLYQWRILHNVDEGIKHFLNVLEQYPDNEQANALISFQYSRKMRLNLAYKYIMKSLTINPMYSLYWLQLSYLFNTNGDYKRELLSFYRALELGLTPSFYPRLRNAHIRASVPVDSIPKKFLAANDQRLVAYWTFEENDPRRVIDQLKDIHLTTDPGPADYTRTEYYFDLALAYQALYLDDSASYYAKLCLAENEKQQTKDWYWEAQSYSLLGNEEKAMDIYNYNEKLFWNDRQMDSMATANQQVYHIEQFVLANKYDEATALLLTLNRDFPEYGNYFRLTTFTYNRAKKEYPPFAEAVANLKLPEPLVKYDDGLERLKY